MSDNHRKSAGKNGYSHHMRGVAFGILVMGLSVAVIIMLWMAFGYRGSVFSTRVMEDQQDRLREQYGLPPEPDVPPGLLEVPPSLRNITQGSDVGEIRPT